MYPLVSGVVFALFALAQGTRALAQLPFQVGHLQIPIWVSWLIALVAALMSVWAFTQPKR